MAKAVEITFAIGAALAGSFAGTFGKAGKALADFQKQAEQMQKQSAQIESYQKMQDSLGKNSAEMSIMAQRAEDLNMLIADSKTRTQELSSQHRTAQQETARLTAENVRNTDAYKAAQLNVKSLENQIANAKQPTAELQRQYKAAQEEVRRLEGAMKGSNEALKAARKNEQDLARQVKESKRETKSLTDESKGLTQQGDKLKQTIDRDKESLSRMTAELKAAGIDTRNLASEQARLTQQSQRMAEAQERYKRSKAALDQTKQNLSWNNMKGELMTAAGLGYTLYKPVSQAADFESAIARVNAVAFSGAGRDKEADAKSLQALSEQARQLGRDTQFTAVQAAQSQENLARAGFKADEIISAMPGLLNMAAAEGMDLAAASDIAASTLRGFQMSADQANRVADVLAQTSAASNTNIVGLGEGMKYVAPVAAKLGVSLEETSAMLGVMANAGIKGTEGGTALRGAFLRLAQEPKAVEKALHSLGVASRDAQGNMRKLPDLMTELAEKTKDMGDADKMQKLADIFGVRAVSGMMAVMSGVADGSLETLTQYNKEATGILKAMSEATGASLDEMRGAMKDVEPYTERLGISYRDLAIYTAMLAKSGATGAIANSQLTAVFSRIVKDSKKVNKALKSYGISLVDDKGKTRDFLEILKDLNNAMKGMDGKKQLETLQKIFKDDEAVLGVQALMAQFDQGAYFELDKKAEGTKGVSYEMAQKQLTTLRGQWEIAKSAMQDFMIETGNVLLPYVTDIVKGLTKVTTGITNIMREYPAMTKIVVTGLGAIAALKIAKTVGNIGNALLSLPGAWLEFARASREAKIAAEAAGAMAKTSSGLFGGLWKIVAAHPFMAIVTVTLLILAYWEDICKLVEKVVNWAGKVGETLNSPAFKEATKPVSMGGVKQSSEWGKNANYHIQQMNSMYAPPSIPARAEGGIITRPEIALIGEAGREAIIPLEKQTRGAELWLQAGRELGLISDSHTEASVYQNNDTAMMNVISLARRNSVAGNIANTESSNAESYNAISRIVNALELSNETVNITGSYLERSTLHGYKKSEMLNPIRQPHLGLVAEVGRELGLIAGSQTSASTYQNVSNINSESVNNFMPSVIDAVSVNSQHISQAYDVIPQIVNALKFQHRISNISGDDMTSNYSAQTVSELNRTQNYSMMPEIVNAMKIQPQVSNIIPHATGGIFTQPHIGLIAEAGREAIIPLEKQSRGAELWLQAGRELGLISENRTTANTYQNVNTISPESVNNVMTANSQRISQGYDVLPQIVNALKLQPEISSTAGSYSELNKTQNTAQYYSMMPEIINAMKIQPHATGGIFSQPHIGLVAEAGREAIIPLEDKSRGLPLWMAAGEELGFSFGGSSSNSNMSFTFNPTVSVTVNGGEPDSESKFRRILLEIFEDLFIDFQERMQRVAFE